VCNNIISYFVLSDILLNYTCCILLFEITLQLRDGLCLAGKCICVNKENGFTLIKTVFILRPGKVIVCNDKDKHFLGFASPCIIILSNWINQPDEATSLIYYLSFKYSSTYFGHPYAHHQELQQLQYQPLVYRWSVVVAVLLVVVRPTGPTTTNSTAITKLRR
jgi:hypothetical protein